jgi:hypothetical protein
MLDGDCVRASLECVQVGKADVALALEVLSLIEGAQEIQLHHHQHQHAHPHPHHGHPGIHPSIHPEHEPQHEHEPQPP